MLTQGAIEYIFQGSQIPMQVRIETSEKLLFLLDEERVLHQCQIYDGTDRRLIKIKSLYTFQLDQIQPTISIISLGYHDGDRCINEYRTQQQQLIPFNINQYFETKQVILFDQNKLQQFTNAFSIRINIKGRLSSGQFKNRLDVKGNPYKIQTLIDCLGTLKVTVISFQSDWNGEFEHRLDEIKDNQEWIYLNLLTYEYHDNEGGKEIRYKIDKDTIFFPYNNLWTDYDQINFQNLGRTFNFFGYIFRITNIQESGFQEIQIINFQRQKVKVIIQLPFAQMFQLQQDTFVGFKKVKIIQLQNSNLALSFNDESKLCKNPQVELLGNQYDFKPPHYKLVKLKYSNYDEVLQDNNQYYRIIAKVISIELINVNNVCAIRIKFDNNLIVILKNKNYIQRLFDISKQNLDEYLKSLSDIELKLKSQRAENINWDFVIKKVIIQGIEGKYEMVKLYKRSSIPTEDQIQKKVKQE